jgi:hypothetical protein
MQTTTNPQFGLLDRLMPSTPANNFLERLDRALDWYPSARASVPGRFKAGII